MDRIYTSAIITIVAAAGDHANYGLPGIRPGSREPVQYVEIVRGIPLANRWAIHADRSISTSQPRDIFGSLGKCKWSTRAWTYQERLLSHILLIFLPNTVRMLGCGKIFEEDLYEDAELSSDHVDPVASIFSSPLPVLRRYFLALHSYSERKPGDPTDAVCLPSRPEHAEAGLWRGVHTRIAND